MDGSAAARLLAAYPAYSQGVIPAGSYNGQDQDVPTIGVKAVLLASDELSENTVKALTKTLYDGVDTLQAELGLPLELGPADKIGVPVHAGCGGVLSGERHGSRGGRSMIIELDMYQTLAIAVVVLMLGKFLRKKCSLLEKFCIPAPVVGGVLFAVFTCVCYVTGIVEFTFDDILKEVCMVFFFTSVGFQANLKVLKSGGKSMLVFLSLVIALILAQNFLAVGLSNVMRISPLVGLCTGSISMVGGHGTRRFWPCAGGLWHFRCQPRCAPLRQPMA